MIESVALSEDVSVPGVIIGDTRVIFETDDSLSPDDPVGFFGTTNGAIMIDNSKPNLYKKWLKQIMSGISDNQRYKNLPMRRISGTDINGNPYAVVAVGSDTNKPFQSLADDWAGYYSGHAYNIRIQRFNKSFGVWTYVESDTVTPFYGDPFNSDRAIVAVANILKENNLA